MAAACLVVCAEAYPIVTMLVLHQARVASVRPSTARYVSQVVLLLLALRGARVLLSESSHLPSHSSRAKIQSIKILASMSRRLADLSAGQVGVPWNG